MRLIVVESGSASIGVQVEDDLRGHLEACYGSSWIENKDAQIALLLSEISRLRSKVGKF